VDALDHVFVVDALVDPVVLAVVEAVVDWLVEAVVEALVVRGSGSASSRSIMRPMKGRLVVVSVQLPASVRSV
jgi:hypothetical protein